MADLSKDLSRPPRITDSEYDKTLTAYAGRIRKISKSDLSGQLSTIDPSRNSIAYLLALLSHLDNVTDEVLIALATFLTTFDPVQARYVGQEWRRAIERAAQIVQATQDAQLLQAMRIAILRMDPSGATYTSTHLIYIRLCLALGLPRQALPLINHDIYCLPSNPTPGIDETLLCADHELSCGYITKTSGISDQISISEIQEYYLLGAFVYTGVRSYERARLFLELVLSIPTSNSAVNTYMVEAYKKLQILGLLSQGRPFATSHLTGDQASTKTIVSLSKPYEALTEAFKNRDIQRFNAEIDVAGDLWQRDGNHGIVTEAAEALRRFRVIDLASTYAALPVDRIAAHLSLSPSATLTLLNNMIAAGDLRASVSGSGTQSSILRFESQQKNTLVASDDAVAAQVQRVETLSAFVKEADRRLALTKEYVEHTRRNRKVEGGAAGAFEDAMEMSWEAPNGGDMDEDIMAG